MPGKLNDKVALVNFEATPNSPGGWPATSDSRSDQGPDADAVTPAHGSSAEQRSCRRNFKPCEFGLPIGRPQEHLREGEEVWSGKVGLKGSG
jgi:hypothetical protein